MKNINTDELKSHHVNLFNEVVKEVRKHYNKMIADLGKENKNDIDWWASEVASRSPYTVPLFDDCCHFLFIQKMILDLQVEQLTVNKVSLKKIIKQYCKKNNIAIKINSPFSLKAKLKFIIWPALRYFKLIIAYGSNFIVAKLVASKNDKQITKKCILVNTFVCAEYFDEQTGEYNDRYYKHFGNLLTSEEQAFLYYVPTMFNKPEQAYKVIRTIRNCPQQFLLKEDYLTFSDYIYAFTATFRVLRFLFKKAFLNGFDITPLVRESFWHSIVSRGTIESLLKYRFIKRLKEKNIDIRLVIEWYENQNIQKIANAGFHHYYPDVEVIGYQGYLVSKNYLCMYPIPEEYENYLLPKTIAVSGKGMINELKEFCHTINVEVAPAFRFIDLQTKKKHHKNVDYFTILVTLPACEIDSYDILQRLTEVKDLKINNLKIIIKPHPTSNTSTIEMINKKSAELKEFKLVTSDNFIELADQADVVISNQSSTCMEALARGVPVIVINRQSLSQNPIPETISDIIWRECYTASEVKLALLYFYETKNNHLLNYKKIAEEIKINYFEPVTRENVRTFFRLK